MSWRRRVTRGLAALVLAMALTSPQPAFGVAAVGIAVRGDPLQVTLRLTPTSLKVGGSSTATETVTNLASSSVSSVRYLLLVDTSGLKVSGQTGGSSSIGPNGQSSARFTVCAMKPGSYLVQAQAVATTTAGIRFVGTSAAMLLEVRSGSGKAACG